MQNIIPQTNQPPPPKKFLQKFQFCSKVPMEIHLTNNSENTLRDSLAVSSKTSLVVFFAHFPSFSSETPLGAHFETYQAVRSENPLEYIQKLLQEQFRKIPQVFFRLVPKKINENLSRLSLSCLGFF